MNLRKAFRGVYLSLMIAGAFMALAMVAGVFPVYMPENVQSGMLVLIVVELSLIVSSNRNRDRREVKP